MSDEVLVIGAGVGGLAAALRLARLGRRVRVLEARSSAGGLASHLDLGGLRFDAGPYVLLDRPGLAWAFERSGLDLGTELELRPVEQVYEVGTPDEAPVRFHADRELTAQGFDARWPGSGRRYLDFVAVLEGIHRRVRPLQLVARPRPRDLLRSGAWRDVPFLLRSLHSVLRRARLPGPVFDALAIWTHVAGQSPTQAPSPMALIPGLIHAAGAWLPEGGVGAIARRLEQRAREAGVAIDYGSRVARILTEGGRVRGVQVEGQDGPRSLDAAAVVSNHAGVGTYLDLLRDLPARAASRLRALPLQSPGVCAYLRTRTAPRQPYLRFHVPHEGATCRLLVQPTVVDPGAARGGWHPLRLVSPMSHAAAQAMSAQQQEEHLRGLLEETWWRDCCPEHEVLATCVPAQWGARYHLYRDSMNPVMTARFMRAGRLAHRSPHARGLYLAGSSTHPGQWVSFCAVSGILAADLLHADTA